ncbi:hypothetical protein C3F09_03015 [candidate division GN15 bacterium]|uniref:Alkaline phosphatase family protein n=1 Tax=candidate division GN15 bacterium TaxID=2072418 RepID=A0A855X3X7_9BACT|nr:MAG: hypothetical protein C3F09_03015 [candidate division GN15 bacterium]
MTDNIFPMTAIAPIVSAILDLPAPASAVGKPIDVIVKGLKGVKRVAIIAPDALGLFAVNKWRAEMPYLQSLLTQNGVVLRSVLPSITPVNFACMVTGTDRDGHGIHSRLHDFACQTLFDVVRESGGKSAGIGIDDYTGSALLGRFADICGNVGDGSDDDIADKIIEVASDSAPEFLIAQLGRVDDVFHEHGPSSPEVVPMLRATDARLKRIVASLNLLGYGVIILADHGQHDVLDALPGQHKGNHGSDSDEDCLVPCTWARR